MLAIYDVAESDTHGKGKLMIDLDNHTFVFNGQGFTPSAQIELRAKEAASSDFVIFFERQIMRLLATHGIQSYTSLDIGHSDPSDHRNVGCVQRTPRIM